MTRHTQIGNMKRAKRFQHQTPLENSNTHAQPETHTDMHNNYNNNNVHTNMLNHNTQHMNDTNKQKHTEHKSNTVHTSNETSHKKTDETKQNWSNEQFQARSITFANRRKKTHECKHSLKNETDTVKLHIGKHGSHSLLFQQPSAHTDTNIHQQ